MFLFLFTHVLIEHVELIPNIYFLLFFDQFYMEALILRYEILNCFQKWSFVCFLQILLVFLRFQTQNLIEK
jgi:hypothetical protein